MSKLFPTSASSPDALEQPDELLWTKRPHILQIIRHPRIQMMHLEPRIRPQSLQHHLHHHALPEMRRRHMRKNKDLPLHHFLHLSIPMYVFNLCTLISPAGDPASRLSLRSSLFGRSGTLSPTSPPVHSAPLPLSHVALGYRLALSTSR